MSKDTNEVRRKLLKAAVYMPPIILGSMVVTPRTVMGRTWPGKPVTCTFPNGTTTAIAISSGTNACCPCQVGSDKFFKDGGTLNTATGAFTLPQKCLDAQCIKSCGVNCAPGQIAGLKCKEFCSYCGSTPVGCKKPCKNGCVTNKCK